MGLKKWAVGGMVLFLVFSFKVGFAMAEKAPGDLSVEYDFVQGGPEQGATHEVYRLNGSTLTRTTDYIPTQYGSDTSKRTKETKSYSFSQEKLDSLWQTVQSSNFFNWPSATPQRPSQSGNQTLTVKGGGKSATHSMWEPPNKERFVEFSTAFLSWAKGVITIDVK
jgi:hypothetical protein